MSLIYDDESGDASSSNSWTDSSGVGGLQWDSNSGDDDTYYDSEGGPPRGAIIGMALSSFLLAIWLLCVFYGTKCCTDCHSRNSHATIEQRRRAQAEAQALRENNQRRLTPEQIDDMLQERARQAESRREFVQQELESYPFVKKMTTSPSPSPPPASPLHQQRQDAAAATVEEGHHDEHNMHHHNHNKPHCTICMTDFVPGELLSTSGTGRCAHEFHSECLLGWLVHKQSCPICREVMLLKDLKSRG